MTGADILAFLVLGKLFKGGQPAPSVRVPPAPSPGLPPPAPVGPPPPGPVAPAPVPVPVPVPQPVPVPVQPVAPQPAPPVPAGVIVPPVPVSPAGPRPGFKKAVEVWQVRPDIQATGVTTLVGASVALGDLEKSFPVGWQPAQRVTAAEVQAAQNLLKQWRRGGVIFAGPLTLGSRRAFRMTEHPAQAAPPVPQPAPTGPVSPAVPTPAPAGPTVPASVVVPTPQGPVVVPVQPPPPFVPGIPPEPVPVVPVPVVRPEAAQRPPGLREITTVRRGEGLANIARRLGRPPNEDGASIAALQAENIPAGPDAVTWEKRPLAEGGIKKKNRKGGLQPGDRLFVPLAWGPHDPATL